jgi:hypothetical protein
VAAAAGAAAGACFLVLVVVADVCCCCLLPTLPRPFIVAVFLARECRAIGLRVFRASIECEKS